MLTSGQRSDLIQMMLEEAYSLSRVLVLAIRTERCEYDAGAVTRMRLTE